MTPWPDAVARSVARASIDASMGWCVDPHHSFRSQAPPFEDHSQAAASLKILKVFDMYLETIRLSHLPESIPVHVALFRDVKNASFLRGQLLSGNSEFEYAFIDASMV